MNYIKKYSAFTLIELLVVISIVGLLASVVMVSLKTSRIKARDIKRVEDLNQISKALELYFADHNSYPDYYASTVDGTWSNFQDDLKPYINSLPRPPATPNPVANPEFSYTFYGNNSVLINGPTCLYLNGGYYLLTFLEDENNPALLNDGGIHYSYERIGGNYTTRESPDPGNSVCP